MKYSCSLLCWSSHPGSQKFLSLLFARKAPQEGGPSRPEARVPQTLAEGLWERSRGGGDWGTQPWAPPGDTGRGWGRTMCGGALGLSPLLQEWRDLAGEIRIPAKPLHPGSSCGSSTRSPEAGGRVPPVECSGACFLPGLRLPAQHPLPIPAQSWEIQAVPTARTLRYRL